MPCAASQAGPSRAQALAFGVGRRAALALLLAAWRGTENRVQPARPLLSPLLRCAAYRAPPPPPPRLSAATNATASSAKPLPAATTAAATADTAATASTSAAAAATSAAADATSAADDTALAAAIAAHPPGWGAYLTELARQESAWRASKAAVSTPSARLAPPSLPAAATSTAAPAATAS